MVLKLIWSVLPATGKIGKVGVGGVQEGHCYPQDKDSVVC